MSIQKTAFYAFNRGLISRLGLARVDIKRGALAAETFTNFMPRVLGSMMLRPGLQYLTSTRDDEPCRTLPFVFSTSQKAALELTENTLRVLIDDVPISRPAVTTTITNGTFGVDLSGWTANDGSGASSAWQTGGYMGLTGTGEEPARRYQLVSVTGANIGTEHALRIIIERGPVVLRVGSTLGGDEYINETSLDAGVHSLAFTPTGSFYVQFQSYLKRITLVDECTIEAVGTMEVGTPWDADELHGLRYDQSGDIVYVGSGISPWAIERRATRSWSVVQYAPLDGPFRTENVGATTLTPSVISGNGTLTASAAFFKAGHEGALFALTSTGQRVESSLSSSDAFTNAIEVTGIDSERIFTIVIAGTWTGTITLQRSLDSDAGPWSDVPTKTWTANTTETFDDGLDNQIAWYRIGFKSGDWAGGTANVSLNINTGSIRGVVRLTSITSATVAQMEVITDLGGTAATDAWEEGAWSDYRGWPSAPCLYEGRLYWAGNDKIDGSVSDGFYSFDPTVEGDSGPIQRSIGSGPVATINWLLALNRMIAGSDGAEHSCRSTSFDEPLTPTNFNVKKASRQGSADVQAVAIDTEGLYVQRGGIRVYMLKFSSENYDYASQNLSALVPEIGSPGIVRMAVQRQPDTRVHFIRSDGTAAVLVFDSTEQVFCWVEVETPGASGAIEDVYVLPGDDGDEEDKVRYVVRRTVNGATRRYHESWALEEQCLGGTVNRQADSHIVFTNSPASTTVSGLGHLIGESVVAWYDGICPADSDNAPDTYTVSASGTITLPTAATTGCVGLSYTGQWRSVKLAALQSAQGVALGQHKRIEGLGLVLANVHRYGLKFGPDFDNLDDMPSTEEAAPVGANAVREDYDGEPIVFPGKWSTDSRLCLQAQAPRPVTVLAAIATVEMHE